VTDAIALEAWLATDPAELETAEAPDEAADRTLEAD
jgi:hypothetical protein